MSATPPIPDNNETPVAKLIGVGLLTRLVTDTAVQLFFPFLDIIARGLGTTSIVMGQLVSLRATMGFFAPLFGRRAEQHGYRPTMRLSLLLAGLGLGLIGLSQSIWMAGIGMLISGLGTFSFTPTLQAYLSNRLPYRQRARGLGVLEYAWALAGIVGLFLAGQLLQVTSWRYPFFILGGGLLIASLLYGRLPESSAPAGTADQTGADENGSGFFDIGANRSSTFATIATNSLLMFAAFNIFITYGTWLGREYGLGAAALGQVALFMGLSDLVGSVSVSLFSDRLTKRRAVILGSAFACVGFYLLPVLNISLTWAVGTLVVARGGFEFAIVSNMALLSEQAPAARARVLSLGTAFSIVSTSLSGLISPPLFERYGIGGNSLVSGTALLLALGMLFWRVREPPST